MARKSYIIMREKRLVEKSSIADSEDYSSLVAVLNKYDIVNDLILNNDDTIDEPTQYTIKHTWSAIVFNAAEEWVFYKKIDKPCHCMLDNKINLSQHFIKNKINGNELIVGSECVKKFGFENGITNVTSSKYIAQQQREQRKIRRKEFITKLYGNIEFQIAQYYSQINDSPMLLGFNIYETAKSHIDAIKNFYDNYINGKERDTTIYCELKHQADEFLDNIVTPWVQAQYNNPLACTLEDAKHLETQNHLDVLMQIKHNEGILGENHIPYIYHPNFMKKHLKEFRQALSETFQIINPTSSGILVSFKANWIVGIEYNISYRDFLTLFGGVLLDEPIDLQFLSIYEKCNFINTNENIWEVIETMYHFFRWSSYEFLYNEEKHSFLLVNEGSYCDTINIRTLINHLIPPIAMSRTLNNIESNILNRLKWTRIQSLPNDEQGSMYHTIKTLQKLRDSTIEPLR